MVIWKLHELMGKKRLKIADVAREADLSWETVAAVYHGKAKAISLETINALCRAMDCQPGDLLVYIPDQPLLLAGWSG